MEVEKVEGVQFEVKGVEVKVKCVEFEVRGWRWIRWKLRCVVWVKGVEVEGFGLRLRGEGGG